MKKPLIYGLIGLVVIVLVVLAASNPDSSKVESDPNATSTETGAPNAPPTTNPPKSSPPTSGTQTPKPPASQTAPKPNSQSIFITSPELDTRFNIGSNNLIKWSREPGVIGGLYLIDSSTGATLGWITPTTIQRQTSYTWDAKDIALSRISGTKKNVSPGRYNIGMKFDGPINDARSNTFYILYPQQDITFTHNLTIENFRFVPESIAVRIGEKITIRNKDQRTYTLTPKSYGENLTIAPGETKTILTGSYPEGQQGFYSQEHSATNLTIDIYK